MKPALLLLIAMCFGVTYGANWAMNRTHYDENFGEWTEQEIADAGKVWSK